MAARLTKQQRLILGKLKDQDVNVYVLAKDLDIKAGSVQTQLHSMKKINLCDKNEESIWHVTDEGFEALNEPERPPTMDEEGITPQQVFERIGKRLGYPDDRLSLISDLVWSKDPQDLEWVFQALGQSQVRIDDRRQWVSVWAPQVNQTLPPELLAAMGKPGTKEDKGESKEKEKTGEKKVERAELTGWVIENDEPSWVGVNIGIYTLQDCKDLLMARTLRLNAKTAAEAAGKPAVQPAQPVDSVASLITALTPLINKEKTGEDNELLKAQLELFKHEIIGMIPQGGANNKDSLTQMMEFLKGAKEFGPVLRDMLGFPAPQPTGAAAAGAASLAPVIQLQNK
ncbi:hypothetical protein LCGC14_2047300, partial [marine sediment metagenome]